MGLSITIEVNNGDEVRDENYLNDWSENFSKYGLSREFCNFICRRNVVEHEAELDQIAKITGIDIGPIYEMENYPSDEYTNMRLEYEAINEIQRQKIIDETTAAKKALGGNIDKVLHTVSSLIEKLSNIELYDQLIKTNFDILDAKYYFSDFKSDKGNNYFGNNFGHDLRNFKRFLEYCKYKGTMTVWFSYH